MKRLLLKCAALLLLDAGTGFFLLSLWRLATSAVFPAVLLNILFSLLAVNLLSLLSASIRKALHHISLLTLQTLTWIYYLFTMVFTGLTYLWVTPYSYCVIALIALLGYGLSLLAVYFIGRPHRVGVPAGEKAIAMEQMQKTLLDLETAVRSLQPVLEPRKYDSLCRAYLSLREKFSFSTPFGRCARPVVQDMEKRISDRLLRVLRHVADPGALGEDGVEREISEMLDITELIKNREKLIVG